MTEPDLPGHPARILLVEDSPDQAYLLSAIVEKMGPYRVTVAQDGLKALELARQSTFDLVLTDLNVPGMDGFDLTARLKHASPDLPIVAVTGLTGHAHLEGAKRAGCDAVLGKPIQPTELRRVVGELLARVRRGSEPRRVLALSTDGWDLLFGCGGTLLAHGESGHSLTIVSPSDDGDEVGAALGADVVADPDALGGTRFELVYLPSPRDADDGRRAHARSTLERLAPGPTVMGYASPSSTLEFRPDLYRDVTSRLEPKLALMEALPTQGRPSPDFVRAHAIYWGRLASFRAVEPFETIREPSPPSQPESP